MKYVNISIRGGLFSEPRGPLFGPRAPRYESRFLFLTPGPGAWPLDCDERTYVIKNSFKCHNAVNRLNGPSLEKIKYRSYFIKNLLHPFPKIYFYP